MNKKIIAVVGAGGKTTYIKKRAKEYVEQGKKVFVTTTTHMMREEDTLVSDDADEIIKVLLEKSYVMAGRSCGEKIQVLSEDTYRYVCAYADVVLVEADGSKHKPIKFPAEHEPVLPENMDEIVVVCGLHALGNTIGKMAHRLELVKKCLNEEEDTKVNISHIQKLVMKGYVEPMKEKYPEKNINISSGIIK